MKPSNLLYILLSIPLAYYAYQAFMNYGEQAIMMVPFVVGLAVVYVMSPHLDWLYAKKNPPKLDEKLRSELTRMHPWYRQISGAEQMRLENISTLIPLAKDMEGRPEHSIPYDVKHVLAISWATMTLYMEDPFLKGLDKIIVYKSSFPSPMYLKHIHACEYNHEDQVILIATDKMMLGFHKPLEYLNTAYYVLAWAIKEIKAIDWAPEETGLTALSSVLGFNLASVSRYVGLPLMDSFCLASCCFFMSPEGLKEQLPNTFDKLRAIYGYPSGIIE